jgi:hypothetical protein
VLDDEALVVTYAGWRGVLGDPDAAHRTPFATEGCEDVTPARQRSLLIAPLEEGERATVDRDAGRQRGARVITHHAESIGRRSPGERPSVEHLHSLEERG